MDGEAPQKTSCIIQLRNTMASPPCQAAPLPKMQDARRGLDRKSLCTCSKALSFTSTMARLSVNAAFLQAPGGALASRGSFVGGRRTPYDGRPPRLPRQAPERSCRRLARLCRRLRPAREAPCQHKSPSKGRRPAAPSGPAGPAEVRSAGSVPSGGLQGGRGAAAAEAGRAQVSPKGSVAGGRLPSAGRQLLFSSLPRRAGLWRCCCYCCCRPRAWPRSAGHSPAVLAAVPSPHPRRRFFKLPARAPPAPRKKERERERARLKKTLARPLCAAELCSGAATGAPPLSRARGLAQPGRSPAGGGGEAPERQAGRGRAEGRGGEAGGGACWCPSRPSPPGAGPREAAGRPRRSGTRSRRGRALILTRRRRRRRVWSGAERGERGSPSPNEQWVAGRGRRRRRALPVGTGGFSAGRGRAGRSGGKKGRRWSLPPPGGPVLRQVKAKGPPARHGPAPRRRRQQRRRGPSLSR